MRNTAKKGSELLPRLLALKEYNTALHSSTASIKAPGRCANEMGR